MRDDIEEAVEALKAGGAVVFPTDTVYGLGVAVRYASSPQAIYDCKGRAQDKPVAWLVGGVGALDEYGDEVPPQARELAEAHWPGALTIIVKAADTVPATYRAPDGTIGLRMPAGKTARALIRAVGPLATSSANLSGGPAVCRAADLAQGLVNKVAAVVEDGQPASGAASTVIDCSQGEIVVVRQGDIMVETTEAAENPDVSETPEAPETPEPQEDSQPAAIAGEPGPSESVGADLAAAAEGDGAEGAAVAGGADPEPEPADEAGSESAGPNAPAGGPSEGEPDPDLPDTPYTMPFEYLSRDGHTQVNAKLWTSTAFGGPGDPGRERPKAVIQIVHGMAEYIDRYDDLAGYLVSRGFAVCAEDHIGHGRSVEDESEYGHMPAHGGKEVLIGDVHTLRRKVQDCFPGVPYVMYGHSMGSFITRVYIAHHGEGLSAAVLSGTGNPAPGLSKSGRTLARAMAAVRGEFHRSKLIDNMGAGAYGKQIPNARTQLDWLSTDDAVVDAYIADPLCGFMFTVGGYATLLDLAMEMVTPECAAAVPKDLPVLLAAGDGDPVGEMGEGVRAAAQLLRDAGVRQVDLKLYEGMRHEIHNEVDRARVYDDMATWVESHV